MQKLKTEINIIISCLDASWYTRDRLATSEKEAKDCIISQ